MAVYNQFSLSENRKRFVALALGEGTFPSFKNLLT